MDIILGLDVSTQCIGLTLAAVGEDDSIEILQVTHFRLKVPSKIKGMEALFRKSAYFEDVLNTYKDLSKYNTSLKINKVVIEEPLLSSNNSGTASVLLRFNGMISQAVYHILGVIPDFISSYDARKYAFPELMSVRKYDKEGEAYPVKHIRKAIRKSEAVLFGSYQYDCAKKLILWNKVSEMFPNISWSYDKSDELKKENFDASDSLVCVLGYVTKRKYGDTHKPVIIESSEKPCKGGIIFRYKVNFCGKVFDKMIEYKNSEI